MKQSCLLQTHLKRRFEKFFSLTLLLLLCSFVSFSQTGINISGTVTSIEDESPLPGVNIVKKGTTSGTVTNIDGFYELQAQKGEVLVFSFIGLLSEEVIVDNQTTIDMALVPDIVSMEEVVVVGYGTQKKKEVTGAVTRVKSDVLEQSTSTDIGNTLQGHIAGVNVQASSGQPGATSNIQIRGLSSVTGKNAPLFIVDGIPYNSDPQLSTSEIESIDVLKDAASAAIYGTRGAGGVILITTKQGEKGAAKINVESNYGVQKITSGIHLMNFEESIYNMFIERLNNNQTPIGEAWTPLETNRYGFLNNSNMSKKIENDLARVQEHSVNMSGGKDNIIYSVMGNYSEQEGLLINSGYERFNGRINTTITKGKWNIRAGLGMVMDKQEYEPWQLLLQTYKYKPYQQEIDPDMESIQNAGLPGTQADAINTMAAMLKQSDVRSGSGANGHVQAEYSVFEDLTITSRLGGNYHANHRKRVNPLFKTYDDNGELVPMVQRSGVFNSTDKSVGFAWENSLKYNKEIGGHKFAGLLLYSMEQYKFNYFFGQRFDLVSNDVTVLNGATSDPNAGSGNDWNQDRTNALIGMLGRLQYSFNEKYLLSVSARRDGSSRFSEKYRWGVFPSVSVGWNVSEEAFWDYLPESFYSFKIRGSYGTTGNQNFQDYSNASSISLQRDYVFGPEENDYLSLGAIQTGYANSNIKWETTVQTNLGFELSLFDNKLTFIADIYNTDKNDMLFPVVLPPSVGAGTDGTVILNVGNMNNKGFELAGNYRHKGIFSWTLGATYSQNENTITKMSGSNDITYLAGGTAVDGIANPDRLTVITEGYEAGAFFLMPTDGIIKTDEELSEYQQLVPTARMGDLRYVDADESGTITDEDRQYNGSGAPDFTVGMNFTCDYKNFDFSMQWYGSQGNKIVNSNKIYAYIYGSHKDLVYQWSPNNVNAGIPSSRGYSHSNYRGYSDYWIEDGSYIRLKNISLGYTLPSSIKSISKLRLYVTAQNLVTFTNYSGFDPEVGNDGLQSRGIDKGNYPVGKQFRLGLQVNF
jgi:TonB-linked SusC/RagA family outer membrane protein